MPYSVDVDKLITSHYVIYADDTEEARAKAFERPQEQCVGETIKEYVSKCRDMDAEQSSIGDVSPFLAVMEGEVYQFVGGPFDKLGIKLDPDAAPTRIHMDGHLYIKREKTFGEVAGEQAGDYANDLEELFTCEYRYIRKTFESPPLT